MSKPFSLAIIPSKDTALAYPYTLIRVSLYPQPPQFHTNTSVPSCDITYLCQIINLQFIVLPLFLLFTTSTNPYIYPLFIPHTPVPLPQIPLNRILPFLTNFDTFSPCALIVRLK